MSDFPRWKYALVAVVLILGIVYAIPNIFLPIQAVQVSANHEAPVDQALQQKVVAALAQQKIAYQDINIRDGRLTVGFANGDLQKAAADAIKPAVGDDYTVAFNLESSVPSWLRGIGANSMPLGLDLQGGVHFLMEVDQSDVLNKQETRYADDIRALLREKNIRYESVARDASNRGQGVNVVLRSADDRTAASNAIALAYPDLNVKDGPSTGDRFVVTAGLKPEKLREISQNTIRQNLSTLRNRINQLGVSEPIIQQQGDSRIVVELAGVQDTAEAKKLIGAVATLEYRAGIGSAGDAAAMEAARTGNVPPDANLYYMRDSKLPVLVSKRAIVTGDELTSAIATTDTQTNAPAVSVTLNEAGAKKMLAFTQDNLYKPMAVVYVERVFDTKIVDGKEVRTPTVTYSVINDARINGTFGKQFQTTGLRTKEANDLALLLRGGSLAAPVDIVEERVIGPSLGADNIDKGMKAVLIGLGLVLLAAAFYYKLFGLVADIALFFNLVILVAVMSAIHVTLTMPGIAGIVLTLGMAIDANVLICERVREELRNGSTPLAAIRAGYDKAWATILDANVTHLIAALALTTMGSGPIRGFGLTLLIGILTSMFTSVTVTHAITALIHGNRKLKTLSV
ncbi:protein translocase subunit SecD [Dyella sp.]|uniref:protein translocase subunit SecD n=1 Tax=Dyella sp. TaxID=1869338 RepID=UPI002ED055E8